MPLTTKNLIPAEKVDGAFHLESPDVDMLPVRSVLGLAAFVTALSAGTAHAAPPDEKAVCTDAYREAQKTRRAGSLRAAREHARVCARAVCPALLQTDCIEWLAAIEKELPSVVFDAQVNGEDTAAVKVSVDGVVVAERLDGKPLEIDPGEHVFKFETEGQPAYDQPLVISQGEKNRRISAVFGKPKAVATTEPNAPAAATTTPVATHRPVPVLMWVLGAVGVVGVGAFVGLSVAGASERNELLSGPTACAPFCTDADVSPINAKYTAGFVALGVGVASLGAATVLYFTRPSVEVPAAQSGGRRVLPTFALAPNGGVVGLDGRF